MTCFEVLCLDIRSRIRQCRARASYRLNRWRASRSRKKWIKREMEYRRELQLILNSSTVTTAAVNFYEDDDYLDSIEEHPVPLFLTLCGSSTKPEESDSPDKKIRLSLEDDPSPDSLEHPKVQTVIDAEEVMRCRVVSKDQKLFLWKDNSSWGVSLFFFFCRVCLSSRLSGWANVFLRMPWRARLWEKATWS